MTPLSYQTKKRRKKVRNKNQIVADLQKIKSFNKDSIYKI